MLHQLYRSFRNLVMTRISPKDPLLVVVGATGTGKSQLAVELASRFNGEIINGDAMQMYAGLPIITNKITAAEQNRIPHHLLGFIALYDEPWRVGLFKKRASQIIREIRSRGRLPILVGGTHYYAQSLLLEETLVADQPGGDEQEPGELTNKEISEKFPILDGPTEVILERLREVDPVMADRWHPNDTRKIRRSLEIFLQTGRRASEIYMEQKERKNLAKTTVDSLEDGETPEAAVENVSPLVFWVHAEPETLKSRLDARVDKMIQAGLLDEVKSMDDFLHHHTHLGQEVDSSRGIWVSIGWKEFEPYLSVLRAGTASQEKLAQLLAVSIEQTKTATRQYARRQTRWIRLKLIQGLSSQKILDKLYLVDGTDLSNWSGAVSNPAIDITADFLAGNELRAPSSLSDAAKELLTPGHSYDHVRNECEICHTVCNTDELWQSHLKGRTHRRNLKKQLKNATSGRSFGMDSHSALPPDKDVNSK